MYTFHPYLNHKLTAIIADDHTDFNNASNNRYCLTENYNPEHKADIRSQQYIFVGFANSIPYLAFQTIENETTKFKR